MYVIREVDEFSKWAPLSRIKVRGVLLGIYWADKQPYEWEESESLQSVIKHWDTLEEAQDFLKMLQRMNGVE